MRAPTPDEVRVWLDRAPEARAEIEAIHAEMAERTSALRPVCTMSGRCCDFDRFGHDLFVTGLEAASCLLALPEGMGLDGPSLDAAISRGGCPFQIIRQCGAHAVRPSGCRSFFCDGSVDEGMFEIAERAQSRVRLLHDRLGVAYLYTEWRRLLSGFVEAGFTRPARANAPELVMLRVVSPAARAS